MTPNSKKLYENCTYRRNGNINVSLEKSWKFKFMITERINNNRVINWKSWHTSRYSGTNQEETGTKRKFNS